MIKHIVLFKLKNEALGNSKEQNAKMIKEKLDRLPSKIDVIREYEVGINFVDSDRALDVSLISAFDTKQDLEEYRVHPDHIEVVTFIKDVTENSVVVDYEI